ncbi:MAG: hypothetical protein Q9186_006487 [Xanthomendoza sp. 1 TL-2023]
MAASFTRTLRHSLIQPPLHAAKLPPTYLHPLRAPLSTITHTTDPEPQPQDYHPTTSNPPPSKLHQVPPPQQPHPSPSTPQPNLPTNLTPTQSLLSQSTQPPTPLPPASTPALLPLLAAQPPYYITAHIHTRPYLLTTGDTLRLPFRMPNVQLGTILRLNRASMLGSRDYTLRGSGEKGYVDERFFVCRARVVGVETEPLRVVEKTKRRNRKVKRVKSKMRFTVLRVLEVGVRVPGVGEEEEVGGEGEGGEVE